MTRYVPIPEPPGPAWLTAALRASGALTQGEVRELASRATGAFNSATSHLRVAYSADATPALPTDLILKRNIPEAWAIEAGAEEVRFYQLVGGLSPPPPAIVPCYAAAYDAESGGSYLVLLDLTATHRHPVTRDQQIGIVDGVPEAIDIERVTETLALHHAYWWDHPALGAGAFEVGYWSRDAERFALYLQRRRTSWEHLLANEAAWLPQDTRELYERVFRGLEAHWQRALEPRFRGRRHLTLVHGDAYFANFLCPVGPSGPAYLIDWQSASADIVGYDLANLCATFWTPEQRSAGQREQRILQHYHRTLLAHGVRDYSWESLVADYQAGLIFWLLVPLQDCYGGAPREYWWPKMQCLAAAFREWGCEALLG